MPRPRKPTSVISSPRDEVITVTLRRVDAQALLVVADIGLRVAEALRPRLIQDTTPAERARNDVNVAVYGGGA